MNQLITNRYIISRYIIQYVPLITIAGTANVTIMIITGANTLDIEAGINYI